MSRIRLDPVGMRSSGLRFVAACDVLNAAASTVGGFALPPMPAAMAESHRLDLGAVAERLRASARRDAALGEELQLRAAAAEAADAPSAVAQDRAAGGVRAALETVAVTTVGPGGTRVAAQLRVGGEGARVTSSSGLRFTVAELGSAPHATAPGGPQHAHGPERPGDDPAPAPAAATRVLDPHTPIGGPLGAGVHAAIGGLPPADGGAPGPQYVSSDPTDPGGGSVQELRAADHDGSGAPPAREMPAADSTDRQQWACWMAGGAAGEGLPPTLPLMIAVANGGLHNMPEHDGSVGFFGAEPGSALAPPGHGQPHGAQPDGDWWLAHPDAQLEHLVQRLRDTSGGIRAGDLDDPDALARWAGDALPGVDPEALSAAHATAAEYVDRCGGGAATAAAGGGGGGGALSAAASQLGVREQAVNAGPEVDRYLATAGAASGNPWCAAFVTWSLEQAGFELPGSGWAAVANWVGAAQAGEHGLQLVNAADARPGDIVAYDWGGGGDFGSDGHIGFLESPIEDGRFVAIEGNQSDAVTRVERAIGVGNVVFIRAGG